MYELITTSAGNISIYFDVPTNFTYSDYFGISIYDINGNIIDAKNTERHSFSVSIEEAGSYYVEVKSSVNYSQEQYSITSSFEAEVPEDPEDIIITGTIHSDVIEGTSGNDQFIYLGGNDIVYAAEGEDNFSISGVTSSEFELNQINNLTTLNSLNSSTYGNVSIRALDLEEVTWAGQTYDLNGFSEISFDKDNLTFGTIFSDKITGSAEQDYIDGLGGADIINGGSGTDYIIMFESLNNIQFRN